MDTAQWPQEIVVKPMEEIVVTNTSNALTCSNSAVLKPCITSTSSESCRKIRPQKEVQQILNCPRCNSTNTKFCYYNNYSLSQPRYFCKTCRRYWTEGGSLRNIPVGGGSRKNNKRSSNSSPSSSISQSSSSSSKKILLPSSDHDHLITPLPLPLPLSLPQPSSCQNPNKIYDNQDLNLGFTHDQSSTCNDFKTISQLIQVPNFENIGNKVPNTYSSNSPTNSTTTHHLSAMELLTGIQSFMPMLPTMSDHTPNSTTFLGFPLTTNDHHQFMKPVSALSFSLDNELGISNTSTNNGTGRQHLFPFEDLKLQPSDNATDHNNPPTTDDHNSGQHNINGGDDQQGGGDEHSNGFWNGMLGSGGGSW